MSGSFSLRNTARYVALPEMLLRESDSGTMDVSNQQYEHIDTSDSLDAEYEEPVVIGPEIRDTVNGTVLCRGCGES